MSHVALMELPGGSSNEMDDGKQICITLPNAILDGGVDPSDYQTHFDLIDRADFPSYGDGPVFIGHRSRAAENLPYVPGYNYFLTRFSKKITFECKEIWTGSHSMTFYPNPTNSRQARALGTYVFNDMLYCFQVIFKSGKVVTEYDVSSINIWSAVQIMCVPNYVAQLNCNVEDQSSWRYTPTWGEVFSRFDIDLDACSTPAGAYAYCVSKIDGLRNRTTNSQIYGFGIIGDPPAPQPADITGLVCDKGEHSYWYAHAVSTITSQFTKLNTSLWNSGFCKAVEKLPQLEQNLFQNLIEVVGLVASFRQGYVSPSSAKELLQELWLAYRYQYTTTVGDLEELTSSLERIYDIVQSENYVVRSYGSEYQGGEEYSVAVEVDLRPILACFEKNSWQKITNLRPTMTNVWDMIPFSFIVDWFLGIGDVLQGIDLWKDGLDLPIKVVWYSYFSTTHPDSSTQTIYFRFAGPAPSIPFSVKQGGASNLTICKRTLDILSLFF